MSYNLLRLTGDLAAAVAVVRSAAPEVLAVQEPPRAPWGRAKLRRFARAAGLELVRAGRGARTTALLAAPSVLPAKEVQVLRLRWWGSRLVRRWWARRGVVLARIGGLRVLVVHLALDEAERVRHAHEIIARLDDSPTVLLGDLNERPGAPVWQAFAARLRDADPEGPPTFPARDPRHRIDAVLVSEGVTVRHVEVLDGPEVRAASDHLPLVADLELGARPGRATPA